MRSLAIVALLLGACGAPPPATDGRFIAGFQPTAPATGEIQLVTPALPTIKPGQDITYCSYLDYHADRPLDITSYLGFQAAGGHHTILYGVVHSQQAANTHECNDQDMYGVKYLGGGGTDGTIAASKVPKGIAFRIPEGAQVMLLSHWINATDQPQPAQAAYNIAVQAPSPGVDPGDLFTVVTTALTLPVGAATARADCLLKQDLQFFLVGGHAHEHATHITMSRTPSGSSTATPFYDTAWDKSLIFDTPLTQFEKAKPFVLHAGDRFTVDCSYNNNTAAVIAFPKEMCVGFGYFFPATQEIDCVDGTWPS